MLETRYILDNFVLFTHYGGKQVYGYYSLCIQLQMQHIKDYKCVLDRTRPVEIAYIPCSWPQEHNTAESGIARFYSSVKLRSPFELL